MRQRRSVTESGATKKKRDKEEVTRSRKEVRKRRSNEEHCATKKKRQGKWCDKEEATRKTIMIACLSPFPNKHYFPTFPSLYLKSPENVRNAISNEIPPLAFYFKTSGKHPEPGSPPRARMESFSRGGTQSNFLFLRPKLSQPINQP